MTAAGQQMPKYVTDQEMNELIKQHGPEYDAYKIAKAKGGITHAHHLDIEERML